MKKETHLILGWTVTTNFIVFDLTEHADHKKQI